jgi:hypothetical protein
LVVCRHKIQYYNIGTIFKVWLFRINPPFFNACWVINRVNMLLFKNHKAMTLIYHVNQGDNFWVFFSPFSQIRTKRVHFSPSHLIIKFIYILFYFFIKNFEYKIYKFFYIYLLICKHMFIKLKSVIVKMLAIIHGIIVN